MNDDLEMLLNPGEGALFSDAKRVALLAASSRILRRRMMARKIMSVAGVLAIFVAGAAASWFAKPETVVREVVYVTPEPPAAIVEKESPQPQAVAVSPNELEQQAELSDDKVKVAKLYREAGDKYLNEIRDYSQAARCYRLYLNAAKPTEQVVAANDSWLLMSMKAKTHKE